MNKWLFDFLKAENQFFMFLFIVATAKCGFPEEYYGKYFWEVGMKDGVETDFTFAIDENSFTLKTSKYFLYNHIWQTDNKIY